MNSRLAELRKTLNLSMEKFGSRIGVSRSGISKMESGNSGMSEQTVMSICREFGVEEEWLRTGKGNMFEELDRDEEIAAWASKITRSDYDKQFVPEFVHMLSKLDEKDWEVLEKMVKLMGKKKD